MTTYIKPTERILNCIPSRDIEQDWGVENALEAGILSAAPVEIPSSIDLRDDDWWQIGDQTNHGACVGFATVDILWWHLVKKGIFPKNKDKWLSRRFVWMAAKEMDEFNHYPTTFIEEPGTSLKAALTIILKYGCVAENELPFDPDKLSHKSQNAFYALASMYRIANYLTLRRPSDSWQVVAEKWKNWLATQGPILFINQELLGVDTRSPLSDTVPTDSSSATVGETLGGIRDMLMPPMGTPKKPLMKPMVFQFRKLG
jgi:hypothetical protein